MDFIYLFLFFVKYANGTILNCCVKATFMGRNYERVGSQRLTIDEVPMYMSVGSKENSGNLIQLSWEEVGDTIRPALLEMKHMKINNDSTIMTEEIASGESLADGSIICPSDMKWKVQGDESEEDHTWTCETDDPGCVDQLPNCPIIAKVYSQCVTLGKICCKTCEGLYLAYEKNITLASNVTTIIPDIEIVEPTPDVEPTPSMVPTDQPVISGTADNTTASNTTSKPTQSSTTPSSSTKYTFNAFLFSIALFHVIC